MSVFGRYQFGSDIEIICLIIMQLTDCSMIDFTHAMLCIAQYYVVSV